MLQSAPCWYSKLVSRDAWFNRKGLSSIGSSCAEKTSKMCQNIGNCQNSTFSMGFGLFLGSHWSDWAQTFFIKLGFSRHKIRVPTRGTLKHLNFRLLPTLTPLEGTLGKIFLALKLHFSYSIVIEHQIKHLAKIFSTKRGEWHTLLSLLTWHFQLFTLNLSLSTCHYYTALCMTDVFDLYGNLWRS